MCGPPAIALAAAALAQIRPQVDAVIERYGAERVAVVVGGSTSGLREGELALRRQRAEGAWPADYDYAQQELGATAEFLTWQLGARGPALVVSTACSSGAMALASAAMPGVGVLLYSAFIWRLTGNPLAWAEGHAAWGRQYTGLAVLVTDRYTWFTTSGLYGYSSRNPGDLLNALGALFVLVAAWPVARRLGLAYAVFILVNILPPLAAGGMLSIGRFSSVLFPAFVWFAAAVPVRHRTAWLTTFMTVQAFGAALFYTWHELY